LVAVLIHFFLRELIVTTTSDSLVSSVVGIVCFNTNLEKVEACIRAVLGSQGDHHVVLLCNSNNDAYQASMSQLACKYFVKLVANAPNQGFGFAHNQIFSLSPSDWYICCNPDIVVQPDAIQKLIEFGIQNPKSSLLMPKVCNPDGTIQPLARRHPTFSRWVRRQLWRWFPNTIRPHEVRFNYDKTQPVEFVTGCFFAVKSELFKKLEGFDERYFLYAEDADLSIRAEKFGQNFYVHDAVVFHEWAAAWKHSPKAFLRNMNGMLRYWFMPRKN
jgi:GT2 family glycosyltransferase